MLVRLSFCWTWPPVPPFAPPFETVGTDIELPPPPDAWNLVAAIFAICETPIAPAIPALTKLAPVKASCGTANCETIALAVQVVDFSIPSS